MSDNSQERDVLDIVKVQEGDAPADSAAAATPAVADTDGGASKDVGEETGAPGAAQITGPAELSDDQFERLRSDIVAALKTVYDPEIPSDIYELGLIYRVDIGDDRDVDVTMTLTAPGCPVAGEMPVWVENAVASVAGIGNVTVNLVFDPPWDMSRMSDEARLALNMF